MRTSGEFVIREPGGADRIIPNQFTIFGMQSVIKAAFQNQAFLWAMGLCAANPQDAVSLLAINEPTPGVNGYNRQNLPFDTVNWPTIGVINGESYVESRPIIFPISAAITPVNRLFLTDGAYVVAISSEIPGGMQILAANYPTSYRLWFR